MIIKVGFSRSKSPFKIGSLAIRKAENRNYSHAYILLHINGSDIVAQASHGYVNLTNYDIFKEDNIVVKEYSIAINDRQKNDVLDFIFKYLGKKYSKFQIFCISVKKVFRFEIQKYNEDKYYVCSEYAARICKILNIKVPEKLDYVTPSDFDEILSSERISCEIF